MSFADWLGIPRDRGPSPDRWTYGIGAHWLRLPLMGGSEVCLCRDNIESFCANEQGITIRMATGAEHECALSFEQFNKTMKLNWEKSEEAAK